jgi:hypothetical protein
VTRTGDGEEALILADEVKPDLVLLDWMIEGISGIEVCRRLRRRRPPPTCRSSCSPRAARRATGSAARDRRRRLCHQAVQPARAGRPRRRGAAPGPAGAGRRAARYADSRWTSPPTGCAAAAAGPLGPTEFRLLRHFLEHPGRVFSRERLLDAVWPHDERHRAAHRRRPRPPAAPGAQRRRPARPHPHRPLGRLSARPWPTAATSPIPSRCGDGRQGARRLGRHPYPDQQCRHPSRQELRQDGDAGFPRGGGRPPDRLGQRHPGGLGDDARPGLWPDPDDELSSTGLYGNFGQANYGAAKLGLAGFARTLALEGARYNVRVNTIAPTAATRMTEDLFPPEMLGRFRPELVAPAALFLVSEEAPTGFILGAGAGVVQAALCDPDPGRRAGRADARSGRGAMGRDRRPRGRDRPPVRRRAGDDDHAAAAGEL